MLRLVSKRILGVVSGKKAAPPLPELLVLPRFYQDERVLPYDLRIVCRPDFGFEERDLETEVSMWDLYYRWMKYFGINRSHDDDNIQERFKSFKSSVRDVHKLNLKNWQPELPRGLDASADAILDDPFGCKCGTEDYEADVYEEDDLVFKPDFQFEGKDLLTEESLWALYQRWMKYYGITRGPDDKIEKRFDLFKASVREVHKYNLKRSPQENTLGLEASADAIRGDPVWGKFRTGGNEEYDEDEDDKDDHQDVLLPRLD